MTERLVTFDGITHHFPADFTDAEISSALKAIPAANAAAAPKARTWTDTGRDLAVGFAKSAGRTVKAVVDDVPHFFGGAGLADYIDMATGRPKGQSYKQVSEGLEPTNTSQRVGGGIETVAELAIPASKGAEVAERVIPTTAKAGQKFQRVMAAAKDVPVDVNAPGQVALRIQQLAERGGSMPMAVRKFVNRITDPDKAAMTYEEARDFASNISRLSANEYNRLNPVLQREVAELRVTLNKAVGFAAAKVGKMGEYTAAMKEYAQAMKLRGMADAALSNLKNGFVRGLPWGGGAGLGYWAARKLTGGGQE